MVGKKSKSRGAGRSRNHAAIVYPDSVVDGWMDILNDLHVGVLISPLHDKDVIESTGELKKPHYHVVIMYESVKTMEQAAVVWDSIGAVPEPKPVNSIRGYARYLCHMDNPEKYQYDIGDVICLGGADYRAIIHLATDDLGVIRGMMDYVRVNQIYSVAEFMDICKDNNDDWFYYLVKGGAMFAMREYIKSLEWECTVNYTRASKREG